MILSRNYMCSLIMISDMLSKHVGAVKSVLKKWFKINDIQLVQLLVMWYLVNIVSCLRICFQKHFKTIHPLILIDHNYDKYGQNTTIYSNIFNYIFWPEHKIKENIYTQFTYKRTSTARRLLFIAGESAYPVVLTKSKNSVL